MESGIWNTQRGIQNPRLSWITLHGVCNCNLPSREVLIPLAPAQNLPIFFFCFLALFRSRITASCWRI